MIIVDALTNNVNRTAANIRSHFNKNGGNMGVAGTVSYQFDHFAVFVFQSNEDPEDIMLALLEKDLEISDVIREDNNIVVYSAHSEFNHVRDALTDLNISSFEMADLAMVPKNEISLTSLELDSFEKLIDTLEEDGDVQHVFHNVTNA